ncbi:cytochrome P450 2C15-like [Physella acuta]|uniref:cytochrome P450 2C15-like n=1 Tax=Physella acuta TaxID=109671 RepID=UPI0027DDFDA5|nr:cytochrome P450 2C15-like [Physella acuta]
MALSATEVLDSFVPGTTVWILLALCLLASWYWYSHNSGTSLPLPPTPGVALPLVGHLYLLEKNPRRQFKRWADSLGSIFRLRLGSDTVMVLNNYDVIKEALVKQGKIFSDRKPGAFLVKYSQHHDKGVVLSSGENWREQRSTSLTILRDFGMGKNILAEKISEEVEIYVKELASTNGKPVDLKTITNISVSNIICSVIFGKRFEFSDPKFVRMMSIFNDVVRNASGTQILNFFPVLKYFPFDLFGANKLLRIISEVRLFVRNIVNEIRQTCDSDNVDSFVVAYLNEKKKKEEAGQQTYLDDVNLVRNIDNLFLAGTETTSTTILWSLVFVLQNPETQQKIYQQIKDHVGTERVPNMSDHASLTYLNAFIMETQRMASLVPFSVPHLCNQDTVLAGFRIPKGSVIFPNLDSVLKDEKIWGDPENFRPERFLDEQGNLIKREELIPFSIGRRICLGESLAKMELFLFLSSMFQRFEFLPADGVSAPEVHEVFGGAVSPSLYEVRCIDRRI